jgi:DNA-directed RNA polymerase subunit D
MIELLNYNKEENSSVFLFYNIHTSIINSLRRIMMSEYKNSAFNEKNITIKKNTTVIHNEILRHRLSLVPINSDTIFEVELNCKNTEDNIKEIYSDELKIVKGSGEIMKDILLYKLKKDKEIILHAMSDRQIAKKNVIYRPIVTSYFKILKEIIYENNQENKLDKYKLFTNEKLQSKNSLGLTYDINYNKIINSIENLKIQDVYYNKLPVYVFFIESIFLNPKDILDNSIKILLKKIENFLDLKIKVKENNEIIKLYINNSFTLSNILSYYLKKDPRIKFAQYNKLHPLDDYIILELYLNDKSYDYIKILEKTINKIKKDLNNLSIL